MANTTEHDISRERFVALVEAYGGDIGRWPVALQALARARTANDPLAAQRLIEAQALDRLLGLAPATAVSPELVERILARAAALPQDRRQSSAAASNVVALPRPSSRSTADAAAAPRGGWRLQRSQAAGAGGMLAASLLIGIWLGATGVAPATIGTAFNGRPGTSDFDAMSEIVQSALPFDLLEGADEDTL